eukprot:Skav208817  [mRNA]  locus=scaffold667:109892:110293:+ [translate_table: standard]
MRVKILEACKHKLGGCQKKTRFGDVEWFEPVLKKRPHGKSVWSEIDHIEVKNDKVTYRAALRTWRFATTGLDGLEEEALLQDAFDAWRPQPAEKPEPQENSENVFDVFVKSIEDLFQGVGEFLTSMPCCGSRS